MESSKILLGVLVPVFNRIDYTKACLKNLDQGLKGNKLDYEIIVVDDGSTDDTSLWIEENYPSIHLLKGDGNLWWSGGINKGAKHAFEELKASHVLLWNNDILVEKSYFEALAEILNSGEANFIFGSKIYLKNQENLIWSMGGYFNPKTGERGMIAYEEEDSEKYKKVMDVDWLTGMGTVVHKTVIESIGYWDEKTFPQYHGDTDFSYRAKLSGFQPRVFPQLQIMNDTMNTGIQPTNLKYFIASFYSIRSNYNFKKNIIFYKKYANNILAYKEIIKSYYIYFGSFVKRGVLALFRNKK